MSTKVWLLYEGEIVQEFGPEDKVTCRQYLHTSWGLTIYNAGYLYWPSNPHNGSYWYRCDLTPVLLVHVPAIYRTIALLLA